MTVGLLVAAAGAVALAETVYVKASSTLMFEDRDPFKKQKTRRLYYGNELEVVGKDAEWTRVRCKDAGDGGLSEGFVRSADLSPRRPKQTAVLTGQKRASMTAEDPAFTAGSRQLGPLGHKYANENGLAAGAKIVEQVMDPMVADFDKLTAFQRDGRVGDFAGGVSK
jgi:hypothetical protein